MELIGAQTVAPSEVVYYSRACLGTSARQRFEFGDWINIFQTFLPPATGTHLVLFWFSGDAATGGKKVPTWPSTLYIVGPHRAQYVVDLASKMHRNESGYSISKRAFDMRCVENYNVP